MSSLPGHGKVATVTGGTGYVGGELVRQLLARGYTVRALSRGDAQRALPLTKMADKAGAGAGASGRLSVVPVPSLLERSAELDAAVRGADYVFHVASPFRFDGDAEADVLRPAVEGTRAVLGACAAAREGGAEGEAGGKKPRRVVVTSSVCAIHDMKATQPRLAAPGGPDSPEAVDAAAASRAGVLYTEKDWNETSAMPAQAYWCSKVQAEREAWRVAEAHGLDVATILPNFVLGPIALEGGKASAEGSVSVGFMKKFVEASADAPPPPGYWTVCDVRDVAEAHWRAAEAEDAVAKGQRFIVSQPRAVDARFFTDALKKRFPAAAAPLPDGAESDEARAGGPSGDQGLRLVDGTKACRALGLVYTDPADTVADMAASMLSKGVARAAWFERGGAVGGEEGEKAAAAAE